MHFVDLLFFSSLPSLSRDEKVLVQFLNILPSPNHTTPHVHIHRVAGDSFTEIGKLMGVAVLSNRRNVILLLAFIVVLPLTLPRKLSTLR